jgi:hypothetical protein
MGVLLSSEATDAKPFLNVGNPEQSGNSLSEPQGRWQRAGLAHCAPESLSILAVPSDRERHMRRIGGTELIHPRSGVPPLGMGLLRQIAGSGKIE